MTYDEAMRALEALGKERLKKNYSARGAKEPLFGVATGDMKPLLKQAGLDQGLAEALYATGNYDAMYFAGMVAEPAAMTADDFHRWMRGAYFHMISDYIVAVTLAESPLAQEVADAWIASGEELPMSGGWSCYCWLLGSQPDAAFAEDKLLGMLRHAGETIHTQPNRTRYAMNDFIATVGISYVPLHQEAIEVARAVGKVDVYQGKTACKTPIALETIEHAAQAGRLGFKRKKVRC